MAISNGKTTSSLYYNGPLTILSFMYYIVDTFKWSIEQKLAQPYLAKVME